MAIRYVTIEKDAACEQVIERSRFIARAFKVQSRKEAEEKIKSVRSIEAGASHNVPALVIGETSGLQWGSDDGEPQGTAGAPIVQMLVKEGLTNVLIVVTRYFGGIKLGTGGLVRAYTSSAKLALSSAGRHEARDMRSMTVRVPYNIVDRLTQLQKSLPFIITGSEYTDKVAVRLQFEPEHDTAVREALMQLCCGMPEITETADEIR